MFPNTQPQPDHFAHQEDKALLERKKILESKGAAFFTEIIEKAEPGLPKNFLSDFSKRMTICKTRSRYTEVSAPEQGPQKCFEDALNAAESNGYSLYSGFVYDVSSEKIFWHCFNVDQQGYVYDRYPHGNLLNQNGVYMGVEFSTYLISVIHPLIKKTEELPEEEFTTSLKVAEEYITSLLSLPEVSQKIRDLIHQYGVSGLFDDSFGEVLLGVVHAYNLGALSVSKAHNKEREEMFSRIGLILTEPILH